jgi:hypothetical protein
MQPPITTTSFESSTDKPSIAIWTPKTMSVITFVLGAIGALPVAIINWRRMGLMKKARNYTVATIFLLIFVLFSIFIPDNVVGKASPLIGNLLIMVFLNIETRKALHIIKEEKNIIFDNGLTGFFIGLGFTLAFAIMFGVFYFALTWLGIVK